MALNIPDYVDGRRTFGYQIGSGYHGKVFRLFPHSHAFKLYRSQGKFLAPDDKGEVALQNSRQEHEVANGLFEQGVSVPRSFGVYSLNLWRLNHPWELIRPLHLTGWLRAYIPGKNGADLPWEQELHLEKLMNIELHKARDGGYRFPDDALSSKNAILQPNGRVVLIDFIGWIKG